MDEFWEFNPTAEEFYEGGTNVVHDECIWQVKAFPGTVAVLELFSEPAFATITVLNLFDGATISSNRIQFEDYVSNYWIQIPGWHDDRIYVITSAVLRLIDITTGSQLATWP
jgi:hypothetical protein